MTPSLALDLARALDPALIAQDVGIEALDEWQAKLIDDPPKRLLCCCGRQVGKSTAAAVCALNTAIYQAPRTIVLISPSPGPRASDQERHPISWRDDRCCNGFASRMRDAQQRPLSVRGN